MAEVKGKRGQGMSCRGCVFRGTFQNMGASCDVCNLQSDLADAVKACENSAGCRHRFTVGEAKKIVIEREGGLPAIPREKTVKVEELKAQCDWILHEVLPKTLAELKKKYTEEGK